MGTDNKLAIITAGQPLAVFQHDPDITTLDAAEIGVRTVLSYGIGAVLHEQAFARHIGLLPEVGEDETPLDYASRAYDKLMSGLGKKERDTVRATIIDLGMDRADTSRYLLAVGRRILAWRVYFGDSSLAGIWNESPSGALDFNEWLNNVGRDMGKSELSRIRIACKALAWLVDEPGEIGEKIPDNPEEVFLPGVWRKWAVALAAVWKRKKYLDDQADADAEAQILDEIAELLDKAVDKETTSDAMEEMVRRQNQAKPPPIIITEEERDPDTDQYTAEITYTPVQRSALEKDPRFKLNIQGQEYGAGHSRYLQYRVRVSYACESCGAITPIPQETCPDCGKSDGQEKYEEWSVREWDNTWGDWTELPETPERKDQIFISRVADPSFGLVYLLYQETTG